MTVTITGASGFIGRHLVAALASREPVVPMRLLVHRTTLDNTPPGSVQVKGDLLDAESWRALLAPGCSLVHLAYTERIPLQDYLNGMEYMVQACMEKQVTRLVYCSTAVVTGRTGTGCVDEDTLCEPYTEYERRKYSVEQHLAELCRDRLELVILRPTAVFGRGGLNLLRMLQDLTVGPRWKAWLKSSLYGKRSMNLVSVHNVVAAIRHALALKLPDGMATFIVSDDDAPGNSYRAIEQRVMTRLGSRDYALPPMPLPQFLLRGLLVLGGRSNANPQRIYDNRCLLGSGFRKAMELDSALDQFINDYAQQQDLAVR